MKNAFNRDPTDKNITREFSILNLNLLFQYTVKYFLNYYPDHMKECKFTQFLKEDKFLIPHKDLLLFTT